MDASATDHPRPYRLKVGRLILNQPTAGQYRLGLLYFDNCRYGGIVDTFALRANDFGRAGAIPAIGTYTLLVERFTHLF